MRVVIQENYENMCKWAANYIAAKINGHKEERPFVLGLPTGSSPIGVYKELARMNQAGEVSFANVVTFNMDGETISHEVETKVTGADVLMKPAAPGTGIIAGGIVRSIIGLTGVKNLISKSLGSTNKVNIAYAVVEGLRQQVPREKWNTTAVKKAAKKETK